MNVLITGGRSNIAYNVALELSKRHKVFLTTHTTSQCESLKEKVNNNITVFKLDITKKEDRDKINELDIDCLINHAGIGIGGSIVDMDINHLRYNFEVNVFSSFELLKLVYHKFLKENKKGKIFVMSSLSSMMPIIMLGSYTSTKAAISMLTTTLHQELKVINSDISISLIEPGAYHTGFNQVMIDNKEKYLNKDSLFYQKKELFTKYQHLIFKLLEKKKLDSIVHKIIKEVESDKPHFHIRVPISQLILIKIYLLLFR